MKNILITGGSGFIGRNLIEGLNQKYRIYAPCHKELDILDYPSLVAFIKKHKIEIVIHAAVHVPEFNGKDNEFYNDMKMFLNLEKISPFLEKIIYFGSGAEFDKRFDIRNVKEEDFGIHIPVTEYGLAKYTMTKIAHTSNNIYNLRLFGIFGKYELWHIKFLSNICCKAVFDLPITIRKDCWFNFLYIEDLINIVEWFIHHTPGFHDYNVCHDNNYLLSDYAKMVVQISGKNLDICLLSTERNLDYTANNGRLHTEISDLHIMPVQLALKKLFQYYSDNKTMIDYVKLKASR